MFTLRNPVQRLEFFTPAVRFADAEAIDATAPYFPTSPRSPFPSGNDETLNLSRIVRGERVSGAEYRVCAGTRVPFPKIIFFSLHYRTRRCGSWS